jgi:hypothetical protein
MSSSSKYEGVVNHALADAAYKEQLISDPKGTLEAAGFQFPEGVNVQIVYDNATTMHFVLPINRQGGGDGFIC